MIRHQHLNDGGTHIDHTYTYSVSFHLIVRRSIPVSASSSGGGGGGGGIIIMISSSHQHVRSHPTQARLRTTLDASVETQQHQSAQNRTLHHGTPT